MIVYRVEHMGLLNPSTGAPAGPYADAAWGLAEHGEGYYDGCCDDVDCVHTFIDSLCADVSDNRPVPWRDNLDSPFSGELFCFPSMGALNKWFADYIPYLHSVGYIVAEYDVPDDSVRHGRSQSVFFWNHAMRINEQSLV